MNRTLTQKDIKVMEAELSDHLFDKFFPEIQGGQIPADLDGRIKEEIRWWCNNPDAHLERLPVNLDWSFEFHLQMELPAPTAENTRFEVRFVGIPAVPALAEGWSDDPLEL